MSIYDHIDDDKVCGSCGGYGTCCVCDNGISKKESKLTLTKEQAIYLRHLAYTDSYIRTERSNKTKSDVVAYKVYILLEKFLQEMEGNK